MSAAAALPPRLRVAVAGASGRMGRMLIEAVADSVDMMLTGALDAASSDSVGQDALALVGRAAGGVTITADVPSGLAGADVLIDFTRPEGTLVHLAACREGRVAAVVGTTGFSAAQKAEVERLANEIPVVMAPNMSVGVNVALRLIEQAAAALDDGYDIEIVELHHRMKVDAPSGTALQMGEVAARGRGTTLAEAASYPRHGDTGVRQRGSIGFASLRGGDVVGDHSVVFAGDGERLEITHRASSRKTYADGSLKAARYVARKPAGLYSMADVLGFGEPT